MYRSDGTPKRSLALPTHSVESARAYLHRDDLTDRDRKAGRAHLAALERADRERGAALAERREQERQALAERRQRALDARNVYYDPQSPAQWSEPIHEPPAPEPWDQRTDYDQDGNPIIEEGGEDQ